MSLQFLNRGASNLSSRLLVSTTTINTTHKSNITYLALNNNTNETNNILKMNSNNNNNNKCSKLNINSSQSGINRLSNLNNNIIQQSKRSYHYKGVYLHPGPGEVDLDDGAQKPEGVPETWTAVDIPNVDFGRFDENTFPAALEGETLEQYCRRVPNIWSPCSKSTDVVDVIAHMELVYAQDQAPTTMGMLEEALIKIPPESADWHVTYQPDYEGMLRDMMFRTRPFQIRVTEEEFDRMLVEFEKGVKEKGIDYHFRARSFHEFWEELTGKSLKEIANVPTWEEEIDRRIALAEQRNQQAKLEAQAQQQQQSVDH